MSKIKLCIFGILVIGCESPSGPPTIRLVDGLDATTNPEEDLRREREQHEGGESHDPRDTGDTYPIHLTYLYEPNPSIKQGFDETVDIWGQTLSPTPSAPFVFTSNVRFTEIGFTAAVGTELAPGLHVYVASFSEPAGANDLFVAAKAGPYNAQSYGQSDVPMEPVGAIFINQAWVLTLENRSNTRQLVQNLLVHEIGHILGIGSSDRWDSALVQRKYLDDPISVGVLNEMGGEPISRFGVPVHSGDAGHWDMCAGHNDLMGPRLRASYQLTELTMASLAAGYEYDRRMIPVVRLSTSAWNTGNCWAAHQPRIVDRPAPAPTVLQDDAVYLGDDLLGDLRGQPVSP